MNMRSLIVVAAFLTRAALGQPVDEPPKPSHHRAEGRAVGPGSRENLHRVFPAHDSDLIPSRTSIPGPSSTASEKESQNSKKHG
jgi:hypothetical protein